MRTQREFFKPQKEGVYLHIYNHTVTMEDHSLPLSDLEKQKFKSIVDRYLPKYNIDVISLVILGNHFHGLICSKPEKLTQEEAFLVYNKFHETKLPVPQEDPRVKSLVEHSNNISEFMREVQREFSIWFNKSRPYNRKGALWQDRFQCQLIQSEAYLWGCLKYIELNPVRANIVSDPADYKYSSFGRWSQEGKHPYESSFIEHIVNLANEPTSIEEFKKYMADQLKLVQDYDHCKVLEKKGQVFEAKRLKEEIAKKKMNTEYASEIILFSHIDWRSKKVIGSDEFIREKYRQWIMGRDTG
jgi:REP element-mobilizing transposase RayT